MNQDSREQFEQAYSEDNAVDPEALFYSRQGDSYKVPKVARAWYWWKRARAGVVVVLPDAKGMFYPTQQERWRAEEALQWARMAIEVAGVKVAT